MCDQLKPYKVVIFKLISDEPRQANKGEYFLSPFRQTEMLINKMDQPTVNKYHIYERITND